MHPLAWWAWALGVAAATTRTTDPVVTVLLLVAVTTVVLVRRGDNPWGRAFTGYLALGAFIVLLRVLFYVVVGIKTPGTVLLDLPRVDLPDWAVGVQVLGPVTVAGLLGAVNGGLRLATLVVCFGAANALANPRRALRSLPAALHQVGTAVVIALSVSPQLVRAAADVRRAQRLRGEERRGLRALPATALPVLSDALDRSLSLASSMDSRGYARAVPGTSDRRVTALLLGALVAAGVGTYGLLDGTSPAWSGLPVLLAGALAATVGGALAGRRVTRTRYRPDPWGPQETTVAASGLATAAVLVAVTAGGATGTGPWPTPTGTVLPAAAVLCAVLAALPAALPGRGPGR